MKKKGKEKEAKTDGLTVNDVNATSHTSSNSPLIPNIDVSVASANNDAIVFYIACQTRWMLNSGWSDHISHDLSDFAEYHALLSLQFVHLADSATRIPYIGIGMVSAMTK